MTFQSYANEVILYQQSEQNPLWSALFFFIFVWFPLDIFIESWNESNAVSLTGEENTSGELIHLSTGFICQIILSYMHVMLLFKIVCSWSMLVDYGSFIIPTKRTWESRSRKLCFLNVGFFFSAYSSNLLYFR